MNANTGKAVYRRKTPVFAGPPGEEGNWAQRAKCLSEDPESMFVLGAAQNRVVKEVCVGCPVRMECLADALDNDTAYGVWGGMTERQRRALLKRNPHVRNWYNYLVGSVDTQRAIASADEEIIARAKDASHPSRKQ